MMLLFIALAIFFFIIGYLGFVINLGFEDSKTTIMSAFLIGVVFGFIGSIILTNISLNVSFDKYQQYAYIDEVVEVNNDLKKIKRIPIKFEYDKHLSSWEKFSWKSMNFNFNNFEDNRTYYIEVKKNI